jgi:MoaA/NifB/PqqE/SkfB family radical SAM enzyme
VRVSGCAELECGKPDPVAATGSGPTRRILQIHPTLRCNLRCEHCYSSSGPEVATTLDIALLRDVLTDARALGYDTVSVSGGEPMLYRELPALLRFAKSIGLRTGLTSNGTLFGRDRLERVREYLDGLAISVDGPADVHNQMRASPRAFDRLLAGVAIAREAGLPFAFIHTLTEGSWRHLPWVAQFAAEQGAQLLQIHPLELFGRAETGMQADVPAHSTTGRAYLLSKALEARYACSFAVQFDALLRRDIVADPELVYAGPGDDAPRARTAADRLGSLVVEADGTIVPITHGFSRRYAIGNLHDARLASSWPTWERARLPRLRALCRSVFDEISSNDARLVNWHDLIAARSHENVPVASPVACRER